MTKRDHHRVMIPPAAAILCVLLSSSTPALQAADGSPSANDASSAADAGTTDRPYWRTNIFGRFFRDQKYLFTTWWPGEFRRRAFTGPLFAGVVIAASSSASPEGGVDLDAEEYIQSKASGRANGAWRQASDLGNATTGMALIGAGYLIGRWSHHDRLAEASSLSAEALLSSGLYSTVLKAMSARTRPASGGQGDFFEYQPDSGQVSGSFPSGHATGAFTVATVFAGVYPDHPWVSWVAYGTAGLVGVSRISLARHFPSDVLVGALLGHSIGRMAVARQRESGERLSRLEPFVDFARQEAGVEWVRRW